MSRGRKTNPLSPIKRQANLPAALEKATGNCPYCGLGTVELFGEMKDLMDDEKSGNIFACSLCEQLLNEYQLKKIAQSGEPFNIDPSLKHIFIERAKEALKTKS